ncbi:unnamed protein product [Phaeothamnion confervicola]
MRTAARHLVRSSTFSVRASSVRPRRMLTRAATVAAEGAPPAAAPPPAAQDDGIFSRHGGKIVGGFLGSVALYFYRSSVGTDNANAVKAAVEDASPIEPHEIEDLRCLNDLPPQTFEMVRNAVEEAFPTGVAFYPDFVEVVATVLPRPLEAGHLLDRAILGDGAVPPPRPPMTLLEGAASAAAGADRARLFRTDFLLTAFSMAVNSTVEERVTSFFDLLAARADAFRASEGGRGVGAFDGDDGRISSDGGDGDGGGSGGSGGFLSDDTGRSTDDGGAAPRRDRDGVAGDGNGGEDRRRLDAATVGDFLDLLLASHQLPAGRYVTKSERRLPAQGYRVTTGSEVLQKALRDAHDEEQRNRMGWLERKMSAAFDPAVAAAHGFDREAFERLLRCYAVCAWGTCYSPRRPEHH